MCKLYAGDCLIILLTHFCLERPYDNTMIFRVLWEFSYRAANEEEVSIMARMSECKIDKMKYSWQETSHPTSKKHS